jgi:hypothetical protein
MEQDLIGRLNERISASRRERDFKVRTAFRELSVPLSPAESAGPLEVTCYALRHHALYEACRGVAAEDLQRVEEAKRLAALEPRLIATACIESPAGAVLALWKDQTRRRPDHIYASDPYIVTDVPASPHSVPDAVVEAMNRLRGSAYRDFFQAAPGIAILLDPRERDEAHHSDTLSGLPATIYVDLSRSLVRLAESILHETVHCWFNEALNAEDEHLPVICAIPGGAATRSAPGCDRACLESFVDRFLQALAARDPTRVAWSKGAIFTENNVRLEIGDGLWGTADGLGSARQGLKLTDPASGEAGYFGIVMERGEPIYLAVRLKVVDNRVAEAEILANRKSETGARGNPELLEHDPSFLEALPEAQRLSRQRLIELANGYFSTLERNDGRLFTDFDAACQRRENGVLTSNEASCSREASSITPGGWIGTHWRTARSVSRVSKRPIHGTSSKPSRSKGDASGAWSQCSSMFPTGCPHPGRAQDPAAHVPSVLVHTRLRNAIAFQRRRRWQTASFEYLLVIEPSGDVPAGEFVDRIRVHGDHPVFAAWPA